MKKATLNCAGCPYKLGLIKTLFDPCERCKEMYKMYGAVHGNQYNKTIYAFSEKYRKKNSSAKLQGTHNIQIDAPQTACVSMKIGKFVSDCMISIGSRCCRGRR